MQRLVQRKPSTVVIPQQSPGAALSRSEPINFMSAKGWTMYKARGTKAAVHNRQQRQRSQAYTRVDMVPEDIKCNRTGPIVEVGYIQRLIGHMSANSNWLPIYTIYTVTNVYEYMHIFTITTTCNILLLLTNKKRNKIIYVQCSPINICLMPP